MYFSLLFREAHTHLRLCLCRTFVVFMHLRLLDNGRKPVCVLP